MAMRISVDGVSGACNKGGVSEAGSDSYLPRVMYSRVLSHVPKMTSLFEHRVFLIPQLLWKYHIPEKMGAI